MSAVSSATGTRVPTVWTRWRDELYPTLDNSPLRLRTAAWGLVGFVAALMVNLFRTGGHGALDTIWIEDSITFLNDAYNKAFVDVILHPESGYYQILPKTYAQIAGSVPVWYAAPALALMAAGTWAVVALIAFMASRPYLPYWWLRVLVAAPVVLVPAGHSQADNDVATLHFPALYALFWLLLWQPVTRLGKAIALVATFFVATSSILAVVFVPLAILRLFAVRSWPKRLVAVLYLAGMALQLGGLVLGFSEREQNQRYNPLWASWEYVSVAIPRSLFGERWLGGPKVSATGMPTAAYDTVTFGEGVLIVLALLILLAVAACAVFGLTRPHIPLALLALVFSAAVFCESIVEMGTVQPRYVIAPALLLVVAVVATLRPGTSVERRPDGWHASVIPIVAFALLFACVAGVNYRVDNARASSPSWQATIREATKYCQGNPQAPVIIFGYEWWSLQIPCERLR